MSISILIFYDGCCLELPVGGTCHLSLKLRKFPSPRWDFHIFAPCLQGGGVLVERCDSVTFSSCTITGNTARGVRAHPQTSHRPDGKMADMPKSTLIFRVGLIFGSIRHMYVPATPANFPSPRWETHILLVVCRVVVSLSTQAQCGTE